MGQGPSDTVRAYELPANAAGERESQPLSSNFPITITPGFGSSGAGQLPPVQTGQGHFDETVTSYCGQARNELSGPEDGGGDGEFPASARSAHVKRIFGTLKGAGATKSAKATGSGEDILPDVWIDVLRVDTVPMNLYADNIGWDGQQMDYNLHWNDDPDHPEDNIDDTNADIQHENATPGRKTHQLTVKNPEVRWNDVTESDVVKLWIIDQLPILTQTDILTGKQGQGVVLSFYNDSPSDPNAEGGGQEPAQDRRVKVIKVVNNDLDGLEMSKDDGSHPKLIPYEDYAKALQKGTTDQDQSLNVEVTIGYDHLFQTDETRGSVQAQEIAFALGENRKVVDLFANGDPNAVDVDGRPAVIRTDPLQAILNVSFGGLAVVFAPKADNSPKLPGFTWPATGP